METNKQNMAALHLHCVLCAHYAPNNFHWLFSQLFSSQPPRSFLPLTRLNSTSAFSWSPPTCRSGWCAAASDRYAVRTLTTNSRSGTIVREVSTKHVLWKKTTSWVSPAAFNLYKWLFIRVHAHMKTYSSPPLCVIFVKLHTYRYVTPWLTLAQIDF